MNLLRYRRDGDAADGEAHIVVAVAEGTPRDARDASLAEEREDILARRELAPVVDRPAVVQVDLLKDMALLVERLELASQALAAELIERANPVLDLGMLLVQLDDGHVAQLPVGGQRRHAVRPGRSDTRRQLRIAERHPAKAVAGQRVRLGKTVDQHGTL